MPECSDCVVLLNTQTLSELILKTTSLTMNGRGINNSNEQNLLICIITLHISTTAYSLLWRWSLKIAITTVSVTLWTHRWCRKQCAEVFLEHQAAVHRKAVNKLNQKYKPQADVFELQCKHSSYIFNCSVETMTLLEMFQALFPFH